MTSYYGYLQAFNYKYKISKYNTTFGSFQKNDIRVIHPQIEPNEHVKLEVRPNASKIYNDFVLHVFIGKIFFFYVYIFKSIF